MPDQVRKDFVAQSKEYNQYKLAEKFHIEKEWNANLEVQLKALDATVFLPDYLMEECMGGDGMIQSQEVQEFRPASLYMEQMSKLYPREISVRWKLIPAFEESFMRIEETRNAEELKKNQ